MNSKRTPDGNQSHSINVFGKLRDKKSNLIMTTLFKYINEEITQMITDKYIESIEQISLNIQDLILKKTHEFAKLWGIQFTSNRYAFAEITDAFENLVCKSLYNVIMLLENNEKCERNDKLLTKFSFLTLKHLQIEFAIDEFELASKLKNLAEIGISKSPKEKSILLSNFCNYVKMTYKISDANVFQRLIVYCLIKLNTPNIYRNIKYTYFLRHKSAIDSDEDYYLSLFYSAFDFLEKLNYKKLSISKNEFQNYVDENEKKELLKNGNSNNLDKDYENKLVNYLNNKLNSYDDHATEKSEAFNNKSNNQKNNTDLFCDGILNMNTEKLYSDYLSSNFSDISLTKFENMHNDMKIILKMIEAQKNQTIGTQSPQSHSINSTHLQKENGINIIDL